MTSPAALAVALLGLVGHAHAKVPPARAPLHPLPPLPPPHVWVRRTPLPMLPSIARVRVEVARDRVVLHQEIALPRGDWAGGGLDLHVAFGAPGTPAAVDAQIAAEPAAGSDAHADEASDAVVVEPAVGAVGSAHPLLGKERMAGVLVRIKESQLKRAYATSDVALLRVRSLLALPTPDASGRRDVVVRLGAPDGTPIVLGRIQVVSLDTKPWITRAEASLCGADADPWPLSVAVLPKPAQAAPPSPRPIAPSMAVRHASDDLCVRWWSTE